MLTNAIDRYLTERGASLADATVATYRSVFRALVHHLHGVGVTQWCEVTADHLLWFLDERAAAGRAQVTVLGNLTLLRLFAAWLLRRGLVLTDPMRSLGELVGRPPESLPPPPLSEAQVLALLAAIPVHDAIGLRARLHVELCYECGLRVAESVYLDLDDLDFVERSVQVRRGKGGFDRTVPMSGGVYAAAQDFLAVRRDLLRGPDTGPLLINQYGKRVRASDFQRLLAKLSQRLGFVVHPHLLRHSIAVHLLRRGADIRIIQQFLGHADLDTTRIYLRMVPGHLREAYDQSMIVIDVFGGPGA